MSTYDELESAKANLLRLIIEKPTNERTKAEINIAFELTFNPEIQRLILQKRSSANVNGQ